MVLKSKVLKQKRIRSQSQVGYQYKIDLLYRYEVDGNSYEGSRYGFYDSSNNSRVFADKVAEKLPQNSKINVRYKVSNPSASVIVPGITIAAFLPTLFFLIAIGSMSVVFFQKLS